MVDLVGVLLLLSPLYTVVGISSCLAFILIRSHFSITTAICCSSANKRSFVSSFFMKRIPQTNTKMTDRKDGLMKGWKYPPPWYLDWSTTLSMVSKYSIASGKKKNSYITNVHLDPGICAHWHSISSKGLLWVNLFNTYLICLSLFSALNKWWVRGHGKNILQTLICKLLAKLKIIFLFSICIIYANTRLHSPSPFSECC